jgi:hypothetical protein
MITRFTFALLLLVATGGWAAESGEKARTFIYPEKESRLAVFQLGSGVFFERDNTKPGLLSLHWTPLFSVGSTAWFKGYFGGVLKGFLTSGSDSLSIAEAAMTFMERSSGIRQITGEVGGGLQFWSRGRSGKWLPMLRGAVGYNFDNSLGIMRSIHLVYSAQLDQKLIYHQASLALSFGF